jgi:hypothetical protein
MTNNKYKQLIKDAEKLVFPGLIFVAIVFIYFYNFERTIEVISTTLLIWAVIFVLKYFRVFKNHEVENIFINQYINKREYKSKPKTIRQKIEDIKKIQEYNKTYNSNYNNFTKYSTNLPTNKDFTFDYLEIQEYNNKNRLATLEVKN